MGRVLKSISSAYHSDKSAPRYDIRETSAVSPPGVLCSGHCTVHIHVLSDFHGNLHKNFKTSAADARKIGVRNLPIQQVEQ